MLHPWEIQYKIRGRENTLSNFSDYVHEIWVGKFWLIVRRAPILSESTRSSFRHEPISLNKQHFS